MDRIRPTSRRALALLLAAVLVRLIIAIGANANAADELNPAAELPEIRLELLQRVKADQDVRGAISKWMMQFGDKGVADISAFEKSLSDVQATQYRKFVEKIQRIDEENTKRLVEIVDRYGWPTKTLVGKDGANAAWLLVQHADRSPSFQRRCLDLMRKAPLDEVSQKDIAYLTDRVLLAEGKDQIYGTQFILKDGEWQPRPLHDPENVDKRRAAVGLPPIAEYVKQLKEIYGGSK